MTTTLVPTTAIAKDLKNIQGRLGITKDEMSQIIGVDANLLRRVLENGKAVMPASAKKLETFKRRYDKGEFIPLETRARREAALIIERNLGSKPAQLMALIEELVRQGVLDLTRDQQSVQRYQTVCRIALDVLGVKENEVSAGLMLAKKFSKGEISCAFMDRVKHEFMTCITAHRTWSANQLKAQKNKLAEQVTPPPPQAQLEKRQIASIERLLSVGQDPRTNPMNKLANMTGVMACFLDVLSDQAASTKDDDLAGLVALAQDHNTELSARTRQLLLKNGRNGRNGS